MTAASILSTLILANITGGIAVIAVLLVRGLVRRFAGARVAYMTWLIVPAAMLAAFLPARVVILPAPPPILGGMNMAGATGAGPVVMPIGAARAVAPAKSSSAIQPRPASKVDWMALAAIIWALGALAAIAWLATTQYIAVRSLGPLTRVSQKTFRAARSVLGPAVVGVIAPRIVVPANFEDTYDETERKVVLAHEEAHLHGRHTAVKTLAHILACLNWFNPMAWIATRAIAMDQELACDDAVARRYPGERRVYAEVLLKTQTGMRAPLGCYWPVSSARDLKARIARLGASEPSRARRSVGVAALSLLALAAGCTAWSAKPAEERIAQPGVGATESRGQDAPRSQDASRVRVRRAEDQPGFPGLFDRSVAVDPIAIYGEIVKMDRDDTPDMIWVQAEKISRNGEPPEPNQQVWGLDMEMLTRAAPLARPADLPPEIKFHFKGDGDDHGPKVGHHAWFRVHALLNDCKPECRAVVTSIMMGTPNGSPPVAPPPALAPPPPPKPADLAPPSGYNAAETIYLRGKVERIEFGATTYVVYLRGDNYAPDPYQNPTVDNRLWALSPVNYFGDQGNKAEIIKSLTDRQIDVFGYRATDTSCDPACRVYASEIFPRWTGKPEIGFGGLPGKRILDLIENRDAPITLKGKVIRFDSADESYIPHGVLWVEEDGADPARNTRAGDMKGIWRVVGFSGNTVQSQQWIGADVTIDGFAPKAKPCETTCLLIGKRVTPTWLK